MRDPAAACLRVLRILAALLRSKWYLVAPPVAAALLRWGVPLLLRRVEAGDHWRRKLGEETDRCSGLTACARNLQRVSYTAGSTRGPSGYRLETHDWAPLRGGAPADATAVIILLHGLMTHPGEVYLTKDYGLTGSIIGHYVDAGYHCCALSQQSFGRSEGWQGLRGHVHKIDHLVADAERYILDTAKRFAGRPIFVHGHSLGGMVALLASRRSAVQQAVSGLVLTTPAVVLAEASRRENAFIIRWLPLVAMVAWLVPWLPAGGTPVNRQFPSLDRRLADDPLVVHCGIRLQMCVEMLRKFAFFDSHLQEITIPFIVLHGRNDELAAMDGSQRLYDEAASEDKQLVLVEHMWHDILVEPGCATVFHHILDWLRARAGGAAVAPAAGAGVMMVGEDAGELQRLRQPSFQQQQQRAASRDAARGCAAPPTADPWSADVRQYRAESFSPRGSASRRAHRSLEAGGTTA